MKTLETPPFALPLIGVPVVDGHCINRQSVLQPSRIWPAVVRASSSPDRSYFGSVFVMSCEPFPVLPVAGRTVRAKYGSSNERCRIKLILFEPGEHPTASKPSAGSL